MSKKLLGAFAVVALTLVVASSANAETYTRDLTIGSTGSDVVALQDLLIASKDLVLPAGVSKGYFGNLTKLALANWQKANGISPAAGYFGPVTRAKVAAAGDTSTKDDSSTSLKGGDGEVQSVKEVTSGTETTLGEGKTEDVVGFDLEADDNSDLDVTSVKVSITPSSGASTRLNKYLDSVAITMDGKELGSTDASDFSRDGATSTATISLKKAVVAAGEKGRFYVTLTAKDSIDAAELAKTLNVQVTRVRVSDAGGAVLTEDVSTVSEVVDLESSTANDDAKIKSSTDTRKASLLKVDANKASEEFDVLTYKFDVDEKSSDLVVTEIPVVLAIKNASSTSSLTVDKFIQDLYIEVDGQKYDNYTFSTNSVGTSTTTDVTATFTIDEGDLEIASGDVVDAVVYVKFGKQSGNYAQLSSVKAKVTGSQIAAENTDGDKITLSGTVTGNEQKAQIAAATVDNFSWSVNNTGTILDFYFTVTAEDEDFSVLASSIASTTTGTATTTGAGVLSLSTGDATEVSAGSSYTVNDGDNATFRVRYTLSSSGSATNGKYLEVKITSVAGQELPTNKQVSPTATINVN